MKKTTLIVVISTFLITVFILVRINKTQEINRNSNNNSVIVQPDIKPKKPEEKPGNRVEWFEYASQKRLSDPSWGDFLTDIENHLPEKFGTTYRDSNKITWSHETTHGIHSHLNMTYRKEGDKARSYGFYVGNNKAVMIPQPKIRITNIAEIIPQKLRGSRYQLYLVNQATSWNADPLYIYDEWNAYVNGATTGVELIQKSMFETNKTDSALACLEFNIYVLYACMATKELDSNYDFKQLFEFTAWNSNRSMKVYHESYKHDVFNWDKHEYLKFLQTSEDAKKLRVFVIENWGEIWANEVFGFK